YYDMQILPNGQIGFIQSCVNPLPAQDSEENYLVMYNLRDNKFTKLSNIDVPGTGHASWNEDMTLAIYNNSKFAFGTLYMLSETSIQPLAITLNDDGKEWYLPDSIK